MSLSDAFRDEFTRGLGPQPEENLINDVSDLVARLRAEGRDADAEVVEAVDGTVRRLSEVATHLSILLATASPTPATETLLEHIMAASGDDVDRVVIGVLRMISGGVAVAEQLMEEQDE